MLYMVSKGFIKLWLRILSQKKEKKKKEGMIKNMLNGSHVTVSVYLKTKKRKEKK